MSLRQANLTLREMENYPAIRLSSSLRARSPTDTLALAMPMAESLGISRVTNITALDKIGIPTYASIRPSAATGSLCVNNGKGRLPIEAQVGAYMEAIEFAYAEYGRSAVSAHLSSPREVVDSFKGDVQFADFCPRLGSSFKADEALLCVSATDADSGEPLIVPAELVFAPLPRAPHAGKFGCSTNGLCSGNNVMEASLHGLSELVERDVSSFHYVHPNSYLVAEGSAPSSIREMIGLIRASGLECYLRYAENEFSLPYFQAFIFEPSDEAPVALADGFGLHPYREIAAIRAISEAAQSRLTHIHGGRDDIIKRAELFQRLGRDAELEATAQSRSIFSDRREVIEYTNIPDYAAAVQTIEESWDLLREKLSASGIRRIARVVLTSSDDPLQVVRVIVPKLESFEPELRRVGPRLRDYIAKL